MRDVRVRRGSEMSGGSDDGQGTGRRAELLEEEVGAGTQAPLAFQAHLRIHHGAAALHHTRPLRDSASNVTAAGAQILRQSEPAPFPLIDRAAAQEALRLVAIETRPAAALAAEEDVTGFSPAPEQSSSLRRADDEYELEQGVPDLLDNETCASRERAGANVDLRCVLLQEANWSAAVLPEQDHTPASQNIPTSFWRRCARRPRCLPLRVESVFTGELSRGVPGQRAGIHLGGGRARVYAAGNKEVATVAFGKNNRESGPIALFASSEQVQTEIKFL
ncbi:hypothetical protein K458DRAFT_386176 [Lentithecium fluviatile CBS 122367]|uniref:Uncharacterized protein n=1 Tax=Lentithecium fluviatile CBS 122367 TaxID=1168545 RepID=A0A6G1J9W0_9PLEO|nr:hypothetical protein K458DRAFT_386176 [Lentithecium fluviatile CBS 122367]